VSLTIYALKPRFQAPLRPAAARLHAAGITANTVTLAACALSLLLGTLLVLSVANGVPVAFLLLPPWLFLRMALNAIDGMLAREFGHKSDLGAFLNELTDVVADAALMLPFAWLPHFGAAWVAAVIWLAALTEVAGLAGPGIGATRRYDGPMGKSDRAFVLGVLGLAVGLGMPAWAWLGAVFPAVAGLLMVTVRNRVAGALGEKRGG
jgi:CDP-diacylglycerol--glycerol-3-phosphate 3-phosphatidyltransferase